MDNIGIKTERETKKDYELSPLIDQALADVENQDGQEKMTEIEESPNFDDLKNKIAEYEKIKGQTGGEDEDDEENPLGMPRSVMARKMARKQLSKQLSQETITKLDALKLQMLDDVMKIFQNAKTPEEMDKIYDELSPVIKNDDLKTELLHPYAIEKFKAVKAKKTAEKIKPEIKPAVVPKIEIKKPEPEIKPEIKSNFAKATLDKPETVSAVPISKPDLPVSEVKVDKEASLDGFVDDDGKHKEATGSLEIDTADPKKKIEMMDGANRQIGEGEPDKPEESTQKIGLVSTKPGGTVTEIAPGGEKKDASLLGTPTNTGENGDEKIKRIREQLNGDRIEDLNKNEAARPAEQPEIKIPVEDISGEPENGNRKTEDGKTEPQPVANIQKQPEIPEPVKTESANTEQKPVPNVQAQPAKPEVKKGNFLSNLWSGISGSSDSSEVAKFDSAVRDARTDVIEEESK